jgi:hypothetical protein
MKLILNVPTWYSNDKMYVATVKETDISLLSEPVDLAEDNHSKPPLDDIINAFIIEIIPSIYEQVKPWFTTNLTIEKLQKKLKCEFKDLPVKNDSKWVSFVWAPKYFTVESSVFKIVFNVISMNDCNPRIPLTFLAPDTPRATSPVDSMDDNTENIRNVVIHPSDQQYETMDMIPFSEHPTTLELKDEKGREKQRLRQAKLRAAIARLKVEEMKKRYLRQYGGNISEEDYDDDSSFDSEHSDSSKKL